MGLEEQVEEREVLDSIFPEEITVVSENEYRILIILDMPTVDESDDPTTSLYLNVRYPDAYPDVEPILDILTVPGTSPHRYFNIAEDKEQLLAGLTETIQENLGMAVIFTVYLQLKEAAEQLAADRKETEGKEKEEALLAAEWEENKKFQGKAVTIMSFLRWRKAFRKEIEEGRARREEERLAELKKLKIKEEKKLTGRQLWEQGLAKGGENEENEGVEGAMGKSAVGT